MKRMNSRWLRPLLLAALAAAISLTAFAADTAVRYEGGAQQFVLVPEDGNLFQNFGHVLPGDRLLQTVTVEANRLPANVKLNLYLRAESSDPAEEALLSQLKLTVRQGETLLFDAPANQQTGLEKNRLLGTFQNGDAATLTVELQVPLELGDDFQNAAGTVHWVFTAEELPSESKDTGDFGDPARWIGLSIVTAGAGSALLIFLRKQAKKKKN